MWQIVSFESTDGLLLEGNFFDTKKENCVIHIHGMAGNFYSSVYHELMAKRYSQLGYNYLTFNNRGSEYIKQFKVFKTGKSQLYGYTNELFEESDRDVLGAINFVRSCGGRKIILQGHSSGCQKIAYTLSQKQADIEKIIFLSPCDDIGLARKEYGVEVMEDKIKYAQEFQNDMLPSDFFFNLPISKKTFLSHYGFGSKFNIFHYYDLSESFAELEKIKCPVRVVFGEKDQVIDFQAVKDVYKRYFNYSLKIIIGADHKYRGFEEKLVDGICEYLR